MFLASIIGRRKYLPLTWIHIRKLIGLFLYNLKPRPEKEWHSNSIYFFLYACITYQDCLANDKGLHEPKLYLSNVPSPHIKILLADIEFQCCHITILNGNGAPTFISLIIIHVLIQHESNSSILVYLKVCVSSSLLGKLGWDQINPINKGWHNWSGAQCTISVLFKSQKVGLFVRQIGWEFSGCKGYSGLIQSSTWYLSGTHLIGVHARFPLSIGVRDRRWAQEWHSQLSRISFLRHPGHSIAQSEVVSHQGRNQGILYFMSYFKQPYKLFGEYTQWDFFIILSKQDSL